MLDATCGPDPGCYYYTPPPQRPFSEEVSASPGRLRIAWTAKPFLSSVKPHPDCILALQDAVKLLEGLGHELVEAVPPVDGRAFAKDMLIMLMGETWADIRDAEERVARKARFGDFEDGTWALKVLGQAFTAGEYARAARNLLRAARKASVFLEDYDVLLTPTLAAPPVPLGSLLPHGLERMAQRILGRLSLGGVMKAAGAVDKAADQVFSFMPYTPLMNATGQPSMSVPLFWNGEGLPIGTMFTGRFGHDGTLFRLAGQLESSRPWKDKRPRICA
jgi:amidase